MPEPKHRPMASDYSFPSMLYSQPSSPVDEQRWLSMVRRTLKPPAHADEEDEAKAEVCVFFVPKNLLRLKPETFMPQLFAFGPYHHWSPHLYDMERYKLAAAQKLQGELHDLTLQDLVTCFLEHEQRIRSHYHKYLDFAGETLAWMMVIDASFLLEFIGSFTAGAEASKDQRKGLWDSARIKMAYEMVARDAVMLENQIPFFLLVKILRRCIRFSASAKLAHEEVSRLMIAFVKEVSPFKASSSAIASIDVKKHHHLLQLLYRTIIPKTNEEELDRPHLIDFETFDVLNSKEEQDLPQSIDLEAMDELDSKEELDRTRSIKLDSKEGEAGNRGPVMRAFVSVWSFASHSTNGATVQLIRRYIIVGPIKFLVKLPWKTLSKLPGVSVLEQKIQSAILNGGVDPTKNGGADGEGSNSASRQPLLEEIAVPSVTELASAGVRFLPSGGDLSTIKFEPLQNPPTLYLPTVSLDVNTEVVMRNLVAYEATAEQGLMVFTRYTEFMNGIIDSAEDVKLLRLQGVILNRMKSDREVADLWNGMSRSARRSKVKFMDRVVEDVNRYYNDRAQVKGMRFIRKYVFESWQLLTLLAAIFLLLLTLLQNFCDIYRCGDRWFHLKNE